MRSCSASRTGSFDLLDCLGIPLTTSYQQTGELLDRYNIACAGYFVYPVELTALARAGAPLQRRLGRFVNTVGSFLAAMPVSAQLTGVSEHCHLATLRYLAAQQQAPKRVWLCTNDLGADELISVAGNLVHVVDVGRDAGQLRIRPGTVSLGGGTLSDLRAAPDDTTDGSTTVEHFLDVLEGKARSAPRQRHRSPSDSAYGTAAMSRSSPRSAPMRPSSGVQASSGSNAC